MFVKLIVCSICSCKWCILKGWGNRHILLLRICCLLLKCDNFFFEEVSILLAQSAIRKSLYHGTSKEKEQGLEDVIHDHDDKSSDLRNLKQSSINGEDVPEDPFEVPEELRAQLPISFGGSVRDRWESQKPLMDSSKKIHHEMHSNILMKHEEKENPDDASDEPEIGPRRPPADEEENDEFLDTEENLPITSEALLESHDRAVVSLAWDDSGSRLLSGSNDYNVKIFDFGGMKSDCKPFRSLTPSDGYPVVSLSWSPSSDAFFAVTTSNQPKIYDRDGKEQGELPLGDMYIRDMKNTKGHIAPCRGGAWHPTDKATGLTCSEDGTLRVWDLWTLNQKTVIKPTLARPGRVAVTACNYSSDGKMIAGGLFDGTVQLWDVRGKFGHSAAIGIVPQPKAQAIQKQTWSYVSRSGQLLKGAHEPNSDITCLKFSRIDGGKTLISRGADGTLKLWDIRKFKQPLAVAHNLASGYQTTECCFSPDEKLILTGIGIEQKGDTGSLAILDRQNLNMIRRLGVRGSAVAVTWHPRLNQIAIGCGDRNEGAISILYDATMSVRGALMALGRRPRKETSSDYRVS